MRSRDRRRRVFVFALLVAGLPIVLLPFWLMVTTSLKPQAMSLEYPPRLLPSVFTLSNYSRVLRLESFALYFLNSLFVAVVTTVATVLISALLAYAFARLRFRGREVAFNLLLTGMMIPPVMLIIPQFLVAKQFHLLNNLWGLVLVYISMSLSMQTFLLRGFFEDIPHDLEEAVLIDGGSRWTIFWRIVLPLSRPGLSVVAIFTFLYSWDEFPWAHVAIKETARRTLPVAIALFQNQHLTQWGMVFAASLIALVPVVTMFVILQRHFIEGISTSGLKG
ncbi:MAG: carbohydrate ABC transporter permease [Truepera sp.]|jgi:multiple sugar transport system permease protein|nr:carbohydrate ABC transporter permease [Truepera sp.]